MPLQSRWNRTNQGDEMKHRTRAAALLVLAAMTARADVIDDWTDQADAIAAEKRLQPPGYARVLAFMHVSMFEAVNAIDRRYVPYALDLIADRRTSREAAIAAAGYAVLLAEFPDQTRALDERLAKTLEAVEAGPARDRGLLLGRRAATDLRERRLPDGSEIAETYRPVTAPGVYVPTAPVAASTIPQCKPWVIASAAEFRPGPPPALNSETWTRDFNEIRQMGALASTGRSPDQTDIAHFWLLTGPRTWNPLVQQALAASKLDLTDRARARALVSMAAADAFIAVFDAKYTYNLWRPVTAVRNADLTGNPATPREAGWLPLGETPMHPEYPCAHCISSAAVAAVLRGVLGESLPSVTLTSPTAPGLSRHFTRLIDYEEEVSNARVWAGFHYRFSTEVGRDMGRKIGERTLATQLKRR
jgi:hypothetical protein